MNHPSRLAVDRFALGLPSPEVEAHLAACPECRAHLAAVGARLPVPGWVRSSAGPRWAPRSPLVAGFVALAAAMAVLLLRTGTTTSEPATTAKGPPAVTIWLKRGAAVAAWDQKSPLRPGDSIRIEAAPAGFGYVTVVSTADSAVKTLFTQALNGSGRPVLTPAWELDARGTEEHLAVLFTQAPVDEAGAGALLGRRDAEAWCLHEVLPKESP
jgi:hypothetical protein